MGWFGWQTSGQPISFKYQKLGKYNFFYCIADVAKYKSFGKNLLKQTVTYNSKESHYDNVFHFPM